MLLLLSFLRMMLSLAGGRGESESITRSLSYTLKLTQLWRRERKREREKCSGRVCLCVDQSCAKVAGE